MPPFLADIRARYLEGRLVVFAGAGVSHSGGLPSWTGLIHQLMAELRGSASGSDLLALEEADTALGRGDMLHALGVLQGAMTSASYGRAVSRLLDDSRHPVPPLARAIAGLAPTLHAVVTTNLDRFLERAFAGEWPNFTLPQLDLGQQRHYILQLHGTRTDRSSWVLSDSEYEGLLHDRPELQRFVEGLFRFHSLLFVGYGLRDPDFDRLCGQARVFGQGQAPQHFALMPAGKLGDHERRRLADAGIELVMYDNPDGTHSELLRVIHDLAASEPGDRRQETGPPQAPVVGSPPMRTPPARAPASVDEASSARSPAEALTVLMVSASPDTQVRLRVDREFREIITRMRSTRHRDRFRFEQVQAARFGDLCTALMEHQPHILHISCHGELDGALMLEGDTEGARRVPRDKLLALLSLLRDNLRMVVLNACHSRQLARDLLPTIELSIGMSDAVQDAAAIKFAVAFYESLGFGKPVETAFGFARIQLDASDDEIPELFPQATDDVEHRRSRPLLRP